MYNNPATVVVMLTTFDLGKQVLLIRRKLEDGYGKLALPGGYQEEGETWQQAGCRELQEETGVVMWPKWVELIDIITVPGNINLIFAKASPYLIGIPSVIKPGPECFECILTNKPVELAYPTHTKILKQYFETLEIA